MDQQRAFESPMAFLMRAEAVPFSEIENKIPGVSEQELDQSDDVPSDNGRIDSALDSGARAWLVVLGGFITYFTTFGLLNSFGVFEVYFINFILPNRSSSEISWIGSTQVCLLFIGGIAFGPIFDRRGTKILFFPGTLIFVASLVLTSISTRYYHFLLAQGVLFGIGNAMLFYPTISVMSHWFDKKRGLALGIVVAGSSLGGILWPIIIERLFLVLSFAWTVRVVGLISLALLAPCCFMVVPRTKSVQPVATSAEEPTRLHKDVKYLCLICGYILIIWGMFVPFYYIPSYAVSRGMSMTLATYLISILNAGSLVGRIGTGWCADKVGVYNVTFACAISSGIISFCMTNVTTNSGLIAFTFWYGYCSGGLISLQSACVAQITPDLRSIGLRIGILMSACSVGALTGAPIGGLLITDDGQCYTAFAVFCGSALLGGSLLVVAARFAQDRKFLSKV